MSAENFVDFPEQCVNCQSTDIDPHIGFGGDIDDQNRRVDVYGYKCRTCEYRFHGYILAQTENDEFDEESSK